MRSDKPLLSIFMAAYAMGLSLEDVTIPLATIDRVISTSQGLWDSADVWSATHAAMVGEFEPIRRLVSVELDAGGETASENALLRLQAVADAFRALV